ncbi:hypothetical protein ABK040_009409 [Willaertia magna]
MSLLEKVQVFDLTRLYPGPLCTGLLSEMGAEVIKIEDPTTGDPIRHFPPFFPSSNNSYIFHCFNRNKKSISLDLKKDIQQLKLLLSQNDGDNFKVLIESFRPGKLEQIFGVKDIKELWNINPYLIIVRISSFGQNIEHLRNVPGHDMNCVGAAGVFHVTNNLDKDTSDNIKPLPIQIADVLTGYSAAFQTTALLYKLLNIKSNSNLTSDERHKEMIKINRIIDISMFDCSIASIQMPLTLNLNGFRKESENGNFLLSGSILGYKIYKTKEGLLSVACLEPHFWKEFILTLQNYNDEDLKKFIQTKYLFSNDETLFNIISKILKLKTADEWEQIFIKKQLPITKIRKLNQVDQTLLQKRNLITKEGIVKLGLDYTSLLNNLNQENDLGPLLGEHTKEYLSKL